MTPILSWSLAIGVGILLCGCLGTVTDVWSTLAAAGIVLSTFLITTRFKVASRDNISKMGTAWFTQELRRMAWRMLLSLGLAGVAFKLAYPSWGTAFWLSVAAYYQVGLLLHLRQIRQPVSTATNTTNV